jgi:D-alanyl-D-alanine carboxypeptidase/D-alanyl-D-alanine-endopeptidase (penicillin-binding protein 4)
VANRIKILNNDSAQKCWYSVALGGGLLPKRRFIIAYLIFFVTTSQAADSGLARRIDAIMARPEFQHAMFGVEIYSLDHNRSVYSHNSDKFFTAASTTKLITTGSALHLMGPDYKFHTRIYRNGDLTADGTLNGDLILVASGDPNLSGRIESNGNLTFENEDHSYGGKDSRGVPGDPLLVIRELASQVASHGVKRITGRVMVDASLFQQGDRELGSGVVISPIIVNDNLIDVLVSSGPKEGDPAVLKISPMTSYARFINQTTTGKAGSTSTLSWASDVENSDGTRTVTISGSVPSGNYTEMFSYPVPDPARYAAILLTEALREKAIVANPVLKEDNPNFKTLASSYVPENLLAEHISPPLTEEIKVILKVSQNLHASLMPYLFSALVAKKEIPQSGFDLMHDFLTKAGLDLSGAAQSDGAGGAAHFTPAFMVSYLKYMAKQNTYQSFHDALPILGKDGTLYQIQTTSPAAGHVFAKTGTWSEEDLLNQDMFVAAKGLAGYMTSKAGEHLVFAIYLANVRVSSDPDAIRNVAGQVVGEIAAAAYETK